MGKLFEHITAELADWIRTQRVFFVATAPVAREGHVNCSPKGGDSFRILDPLTVAYQDLTGSGVETIAHLRENGRVTIMFCAFQGAPRILRLYGQGRAVEPVDADWQSYRREFPNYRGVRSVIVVDVERIADSCGYAVPRYDFVEQRSTLLEYSEKKGEAGMAQYRADKNRASIDGLPGLRSLSST